MKWSIAYSTGVERLDEQHQMLFRMSEDFRAALDEGRGQGVFGVLLDSLDAFAGAHFSFEEGCMTRCVCPAAQENRQAHATFIAVIAGFRRGYSASGFDRSAAQRLVQFIDRWLIDHICRIDVQLKTVVGRLE